ncbi:response regulator [Metallumcola ferriviriculae]|uniref:Stage 0 sporulation protein A homolog n=1 Tax=Metallumcola ferriviriculae TaxID=3039180 RepID=A0AAU0UJK7_9FIRM|nr:response regulator [Desulfitibacteraceae bacterium MK1]
MSGNGARILVIDDEQQIRKMLKVALTAQGYKVEEAGLGQEGLERVALFHPDLVILDLGLPDIDGFEVIDNLREWSQVPVVILSVKEQEEDKVRALDAGAADYVTKPFGMGELLARIRVALRHAANTEDEPVIGLGELTIDLAHRQVIVSGKEIRLTPIEYDILKNLAQHAGKVLTHRQLLSAIWGKEYQNQHHYLRVYIGQLRRKIEPDPTQPTYIITDPGVGYRLMIIEW